MTIVNCDFPPQSDQIKFQKLKIQIKIKFCFISRTVPEVCTALMHSRALLQCCRIGVELAVEARMIGWGIRFNAYIFFQLRLIKVVVAHSGASGFVNLVLH